MTPAWLIPMAQQPLCYRRRFKPVTVSASLGSSEDGKRNWQWLRNAGPQGVITVTVRPKTNIGPPLSAALRERRCATGLRMRTMADGRHPESARSVKLVLAFKRGQDAGTGSDPSWADAAVAIRLFSQLSRGDGGGPGPYAELRTQGAGLIRRSFVELRRLCHTCAQRDFPHQ